MNEKSNKQINGYPIESAVDVAKSHLPDILNVADWAGLMGYSPGHFSVKIKKYFGKYPVVLLREIRYNRIKECILADSRQNSYSIARQTGLKDDDALCKFLRRHFGTNYTDLRHKLMKKNNSGH